MKIRFETKAESKERQLKAFLQKSPDERFLTFLKMSEAYAKLFDVNNSRGNDNNFIIEKKQ